ncbi:MAG: NERD domain-containing protein [Cyanobacteriota bacterium ELA615]
MALTIPDSCPAKASGGEKNLFKILRDGLPDDYYLWYEPIVENRFPDFTVLSPTFGLLILEVKGWSCNYIKQANSNTFKIQKQESDAIENHDSPLRQCKGYLDVIHNKMKQYQILCQQDGEFEGKLAFPIGYGVIMSNITKNQAEKSGIYDILPNPQVAYKDEFLAWDSIEERILIKRLQEMFSIRFSFPALNDDQISTIKGILHPETAIKEIPAAQKSISIQMTLKLDSPVIVTLDAKQENLAKNIGNGHRIFFGVAGSGKTLLLISRAKLLSAINDQKILIVCYNIILACHLRSLLAKYQQIEVFHFHAWAKTILGRLPKPGLVPDEEYDLYMGELLLKKLKDCSYYLKYDSICVDEAHTFEPIWFQCCVEALKDPDDGNLIIVSDGSQKLYKRRNFTWSSVNIKARGRTFSQKFNLDKNYRNTKEILSFAWNVIKNCNKEQINETEEDPVAAFPIIEPTGALRNGEQPTLHITFNQTESILKQVEYLRNSGYQSEDIAILYRKSIADNKSTIDELCNQLHIRGLGGGYWISKDRESKVNYNLKQTGVRIVTVLSSLGLEFRAVLILWLEQFYNDCLSKDFEIATQARRELYVGMTRAQETLHLFTSKNSSFLQELIQSQAITVKSEDLTQ